MSDSLGMDYKTSFENVNRMQNSIRPWTDCQIFFFFNSDTEFEIHIYEHQLTPEQNSKVDENLYSTKPYGLMRFEESGEELLYYKDDGIVISFGLFSETLLQVHYRNPIDIKAVQAQFLLLEKLLKNK